MKRLWITGYRSYELGIFKNDDPKLKVIQSVLQREIVQAIESGVNWFITGAQMGIEQWSVAVLNKMKEKYPQEFQIATMLPFEKFGSQWNENNQLKLQSILKKADFSATTSKQPYQSPQQLRNYQEFMLNHTDAALLIYDIDNEGKTKYDYQAIINYAKHHSYDYHLINFDDLQEAATEYQENYHNELQS